MPAGLAHNDRTQDGVIHDHVSREEAGLLHLSRCRFPPAPLGYRRTSDEQCEPGDRGPSCWSIRYESVW